MKDGRGKEKIARRSATLITLSEWVMWLEKKKKRDAKCVNDQANRPEDRPRPEIASQSRKIIRKSQYLRAFQNFAKFTSFCRFYTVNSF